MKGEISVNSEEVAQLKIVSALFNEISSHEQKTTVTDILDMLFDVLLGLVFSVGEKEAKSLNIHGYLEKKQKLKQIISK